MQIKFIQRSTGQIEIENPPAEGLLKFLYQNAIGKNLVLPLIRNKLVSEVYGRRMDRPKSTKGIKSFVAEYKIDLSEAEKELHQFTSFNDFFYRKLKSGSRPIGDGFVSPGDGRLLAFHNVSEVETFFVKGQKFTLENFLADADLAAKYKDAAMFILRLAPNDYHRFHFPYTGFASAMHHIPGYYFSVSPYAVMSNFAKVFCENKRAYCIVKTAHIGDVLVAPVGAAMVGSIEATYNPNTQVEKGDEMGYFAFGGSTIVIFVERDKIRIDADILKNTKNKLETFVKMGEKIGI